MMSDINFPGLLGLLGILLVLLVVVWFPTMRTRSQEDTGDGIAHCVLPARPQKASMARGLLFFAAGVPLNVLIVAASGWLSYEYRSLLVYLAEWPVRVPQLVVPSARQAYPTLPLATAVYFICLSLTIRGSAGRRLALLSNAALFLALTTTIDALLTVLGALTDGTIHPDALGESLMSLLAGYLIFVRTIMSTFVLPRPTRLPNQRPRWLQDRVMMILALAAGLAIAVLVLTVLRLPSVRGSTTAVFLSFFVFSGFFTTIAVFLYSARWAGPPPPPYLNPPPPVNVIVAAYNEEDILTENLQAIDEAAAYYGGPVHVVVANDGSTDSTVEVAESVFGRYTAATGEVVTRPNGGIARAYNTALEHCTRDYIVRIDADTLIDRKALPNIVRWLPNHEVGQVSALYLPRTDLKQSWLHRMRLLECLFGFGFARQGHSVVDGVVCAPGPLAAFRRNVALHVRGYTTGMNGEDLDFTNKIGRSGYRVILDPNVVAYEDVPHTVNEFRAQRHRWSRAGIHCFARFSPFSSGAAGPRTWFMFPRLVATRFTGPLRLLVLMHAFTVAVLHPTYRGTVATAFVLYLSASLPTLLIATALLFRYGFIAKVPWLLAWYPFLLFRRFVVLEGLLSLPTKPATAAVRVPRPARFRPRALPEPSFTQ